MSKRYSARPSSRGPRLPQDADMARQLLDELHLLVQVAGLRKWHRWGRAFQWPAGGVEEQALVDVLTPRSEHLAWLWRPLSHSWVSGFLMLWKESAAPAGSAGTSGSQPSCYARGSGAGRKTGEVL